MHSLTRRRTVVGTLWATLLVFGCLARGPSKKRGRCLLTKFGLAQFTARLLWRLGEQWHLAVNVFDTLSRHTFAACSTRPIRTHHNDTPLTSAKPPGR